MGEHHDIRVGIVRSTLDGVVGCIPYQDRRAQKMNEPVTLDYLVMVLIFSALVIPTAVLFMWLFNALMLAPLVEWLERVGVIKQTKGGES
jgi:hypothetical protein